MRGLNKTAQSIACGEDSSIEITILDSKKLTEPLPPSSTQPGKACRLYYGGREEGRGIRGGLRKNVWFIIRKRAVGYLRWSSKQWHEKLYKFQWGLSHPFGPTFGDPLFLIVITVERLLPKKTSTIFQDIHSSNFPRLVSWIFIVFLNIYSPSRASF